VNQTLCEQSMRGKLTKDAAQGTRWAGAWAGAGAQTSMFFMFFQLPTLMRFIIAFICFMGPTS